MYLIRIISNDHWCIFAPKKMSSYTYEKIEEAIDNYETTSFNPLDTSNSNYYQKNNTIYTEEHVKFGNIVQKVEDYTNLPALQKAYPELFI